MASSSQALHSSSCSSRIAYSEVEKKIFYFYAKCHGIKKDFQVLAFQECYCNEPLSLNLARKSRLGLTLLSCPHCSRWQLSMIFDCSRKSGPRSFHARRHQHEDSYVDFMKQSPTCLPSSSHLMASCFLYLISLWWRL